MSVKFQRMLLLGSVSLLPMLVHAQTAPVPMAGTKSTKLEEVTVTAQKRKQNLQTVPISMVALSGKGLADKSVKTLSDLQFAAPSLTVANAGLTQSVNIRGIGLSSGSPNAANGVASYLDGVFVPPTVSAGQYYDIADVEVLRGPQGTFVGSNSTGGAIFVNTMSPQLGKYGGFGQVNVGSYGTVGFTGAVNIPITDTLAVRVAVDDQNHNSYYKSVGPVATKAGSLRELDDRFGITWKPVEQYQATFKIDQIERETGGYAYQPVPGTSYAKYFTSPDIYSLDYNSPTENAERAIQGTLDQRFTADDGIVIKSITGYQNRQIQNLYDMDGTASVKNSEDQFVREKVYTQELDVLSPTDQRLSWIAGGYFQRNRIDVIIAENTGLPVNILVQNKKTTLGAFGQVAYKVTDTLTATLGARYSHYEVSGTGGVIVGRGVISPTGIHVGNTGGYEADQAPTGKFDLDWNFAPKNMLYAFVARGYKSGGILTPTTDFAKETVWDYELGWKSTLLDGHLKTQLDGFYNQYKNFQYDTVNPTTGQSAVANAANATIDGIEASAQARIDNWGADASMAYVHSVMGTYTVIDQNLLPPGTLLPQCATGQTVGCTNYVGATKTISGAPNLHSPDFTFNGGLQYTATMDDGILVTPRLNYSYQTSQDTSPARDSFYVIHGYGLLSALITVNYGPWTVQATGTNLTGQKYVTGFMVSGSAGSQFYGAPREFNVSLRRDF